MARLTYAELQEQTDTLAARRGSVPAGVRDNRLVARPSTNPLPGDYTPVRSIPRGRSPLGVIGALTDLSCTIYNRAPNAFVNDFASSGVPSLSNSTKHGLMKTVCGSPPGPSGPGVPPAPPPGQIPFSGGQCVCKQYDVWTRITDPNKNGDVTRRRQNLRGPIFGVRAVTTTGPDGEINSTFAEIDHGDPSCGGIKAEEVSPGVSSDGEPGNVSIVRIEPSDGVDDCGDPPAIPAFPSGDPPRSPDISIDPGDGAPPQNFRPSYNFDIGPNGIYLGVDLGGFSFNLDLGGVEFNFNEAPPIPDCPDSDGPTPGDEVEDPTQPVVSPPPNEPPADDPTDETTRVIRGAVVTASGGDGGSTKVLAPAGSPSANFPDLGIIFFKVKSPSGQTGWTTPVKIQTPQQAVSVDWPYGAVNYGVLTRPGVSFAVKLLYEELSIAPA